MYGSSWAWWCPVRKVETKSRLGTTTSGITRAMSSAEQTAIKTDNTFVTQ